MEKLRGKSVFLLFVKTENVPKGCKTCKISIIGNLAKSVRFGKIFNKHNISRGELLMSLAEREEIQKTKNNHHRSLAVVIAVLLVGKMSNYSSTVMGLYVGTRLFMMDQPMR